MKTHFYLEDILKICDHKHLCAEDIFLALQKQHTSVAKASIYRNIDKLVQTKQLTKLSNIKGKALYEKTIKPHAHFICEDSGELFDIEFKTENLNLKIPK